SRCLICAQVASPVYCPLSLHDALPISEDGLERAGSVLDAGTLFEALEDALIGNKAGDEVKQHIEFPEDFGNKDLAGRKAAEILGDRKSTRLNSSDVSISYPVCYLEHTL